MFEDEEVAEIQRRQAEKAAVRGHSGRPSFLPVPPPEIVRRHLAKFCCVEASTVRISPMTEQLTPSPP